MKQTIVPKKESPLLAYAVSKLNPEIFTHSVWLRFGRIDISLLPQTVENLTQMARQMEYPSPGDACQILLMCALYQNHLGAGDQAKASILHALALSQQSGHVNNCIWAYWGACAISFQRNKYDEAASYLKELSSLLTAQDEWLLADFVEIIMQALRQPSAEIEAMLPGSSSIHHIDYLIYQTFTWLQQFGFYDSHPGSSKPRKRKVGWQLLRYLFQRSSKTSREQQPVNLSEKVGGSKQPNFNIFHPSRSVQNNAPLGTQVDSHHLQVTRSTSTTCDPKPDLQSIPIIRPTPEAPTENLSLTVQMLGTFGMRIGDLPIKLPASRGLSILKYLILHHNQHTSRELLMDLFWPDAEPETARNNLNVAIHSLRKALRSVIFLPVILFENGAYGLEPELQVWIDVEEFEKCIRAAQVLEAGHQLTRAVANYEIALNLYRGDLLADSPYEDWVFREREHLRVAYLDTLDRLSHIYLDQKQYAACVIVCNLILDRDRCREDTHCLLMRCYSGQGQYHMALHQFQSCVEALQMELEVEPAPETIQLYNRIRRHEQV